MNQDALEAGDETFVRRVTMPPTPPSLDYHCRKCGKPITNWTARIGDDTKLVLTAKCHGLKAEMTIWLGMGGDLF